MIHFASASFRWFRQHSAFLILAILLFGFFATEYRSIIVQFDASADRVSELEIEFASTEQAYSLHSKRLIKLAPGRVNPVRLEMASRTAIDRVRIGLSQGSVAPRLTHIRLLAPRTGQSFDGPPMTERDVSGQITDPQALPSGEFQLLPGHWLEIEIPDTLYRQPVYQWVELGALLILYIVFALAIDGRRLRYPGASGSSRWAEFGLALSCIVLAAMGTHLISYGSIVGDAEENLATAFNLLHHGTYSHFNTEQPLSSNLREPVPTFFYAAWLVIIGQFDHVINLNHLWGGTGTYAVKLGNFFWIYAGLVAFSKIIYRLLPSYYISGIGLLLSFFTFFGNAQWVDSLYTELHTAVLLLWLAHFTIAAQHQPSRKYLVGVGVFAGLLILTKAIFLYVFLVLAAAWILAWVRKPTASARRHTQSHAVATVVLGALLVVAPWAARNAIQFGSPSISSVRGGGVMYYRAMLDEMNPEEVKGLLYLNGPASYRALIDRFFGAPRREDFQREGRWARLYIGPSNFQTADKLARLQGRPQDAVSFHQKSSAEFVKRIQTAKVQGSSYPERDADQSMGREAVRYFLHHPLRHIAFSLPFFWAGFWGFGNGFFAGHLAPSWGTAISVVFDAINLAAGASLLLVFGLGLKRADPSLLALSAPAVLMVGAYTAISQNLPRFFAPTHPIMVLCLMVLLFGAAKRPRGSRTPEATDHPVGDGR